MRPDIEKLIAEMRAARAPLEEALGSEESFRALRQLDARIELGEPLEVIGQADLRARLEADLAGNPDYAALRRLDDALAVLEARDEQTVEAPPAAEDEVGSPPTPEVDEALHETAEETTTDPTPEPVAEEPVEEAGPETIEETPGQSDEAATVAATAAVATAAAAAAAAAVTVEDIPVPDDQVSEPAADDIAPPPAETDEPDNTPTDDLGSRDTGGDAAGGLAEDHPTPLIHEAGPADDLILIKGIDKVREAALNAAGVTSFGQIAGWSSADVASIGAKLGLDGQIARQGWIEQAAILAAGGMTVYARRLGLGAAIAPVPPIMPAAEVASPEVPETAGESPVPPDHSAPDTGPVAEPMPEVESELHIPPEVEPDASVGPAAIAGAVAGAVAVAAAVAGGEATGEPGEAGVPADTSENAEQSDSGMPTENGEAEAPDEASTPEAPGAPAVATAGRENTTSIASIVRAAVNLAEARGPVRAAQDDGDGRASATSAPEPEPEPGSEATTEAASDSTIPVALSTLPEPEAEPTVTPDPGPPAPEPAAERAQPFESTAPAAEPQTTVERRYRQAIEAAEPDQFGVGPIEDAEAAALTTGPDEAPVLAPATTFRELSEASVEISREPDLPAGTDPGDASPARAGTQPQEVTSEDIAPVTRDTAFMAQPGEIPEASVEIRREGAPVAPEAAAPETVAARPTERKGLVRRFVRVLRGDDE